MAHTPEELVLIWRTAAKVLEGNPSMLKMAPNEALAVAETYKECAGSLEFSLNHKEEEGDGRR